MFDNFEGEVLKQGPKDRNIHFGQSGMGTSSNFGYWDNAICYRCLIACLAYPATSYNPPKRARNHEK